MSVEFWTRAKKVKWGRSSLLSKPSMLWKAQDCCSFQCRKITVHFGAHSITAGVCSPLTMVIFLKRWLFTANIFFLSLRCFGCKTKVPLSCSISNKAARINLIGKKKTERVNKNGAKPRWGTLCSRQASSSNTAGSPDQKQLRESTRIFCKWSSSPLVT